MPWYGLPMRDQWSATATNQVQWLTSSYAKKVSLHTATYTPANDTHQFQTALTNEVTGTNYVAGGVTLLNASATLTYDTGTDEIRLDEEDAVWTTATIASIRYAVLWIDGTGAAATDPLVAYYDLGAQSVTAATFTVQWDATGLVKVDVT
jgi:hypothetical protein